MGIKLKNLRNQVMVVTGASSGIGRATAEMAAERGARVVLSSRNEAELKKAVDGIRERGGVAVHLVADVADPDAMEQLAKRALAEFGTIDTWVNNAGVGLYGRTTEVPLADKRRMFDINFWGVVHGCRAAVPILRQRGGALVNIGSVTSDRAVPLLGIYSASKHAVKGYTDALRMELEEEDAPISVSLVNPSSTNTPFTEHAGNYMDSQPEYGPPVYAPEAVARAILRCAERPTRNITVGGGGKMMAVMGAVAPRLTDTVMERTMFEAQKKDAPPYHHRGSLDAPQANERRYGSTEHYVMKRSAYTSAAMSDVGRLLPALALGAATVLGISAIRRGTTADGIVPLDAVAPGVAGLRVVLVNVFGVRHDKGWTLVDAGLYGSAGRIRRWAAEHFGDTPPDAIILTHAHFDHVGALDDLVNEWNVPVYAHFEELPYVTGQRGYPPPDPTVGGGLMARMARLYPHDPIDLGPRVQELPPDFNVPTLPGWQWIHTPGHTAGHVSLYRASDGTLIVGDAFCTTKQESFLAVATQRPELHGPPSYFTTDWDAARDSVRRLAALGPQFIAPGHGHAVSGDLWRGSLMELANRFDELARPEHGRYVERPVRG